LVGTVDTVTRTLEKLRRRPPIDWVFCYTYYSLVPHDVLKTIERFWTEVMPREGITPIGAPIRGKTRRQARALAALHPSAKPPNVSSPGLLSITCKSFAATVNSAAQAH
jgi:hypothetical protein